MPKTKKKREKDYGVITPEKFKNLMRYHSSRDGSTFINQMKMESIMCMVLEQKGYIDGARQVERSLFWMHGFC